MREGALRLNAERPQNAGTARTPEELPGTDARGPGSPARCVLRQCVAGWRRAKSCAAAVSAAATLRSASGATRDQPSALRLHWALEGTVVVLGSPTA